MEVIPEFSSGSYHHIDNGGLMFHVSKDGDVKVDITVSRYENVSRFEFNLAGNALAQLEMMRDTLNEAITKLKALEPKL